MPLPAHRHGVPTRFPDLLDWLESPWSAVLPEGADPDRITASYDQGILTITVPVPPQTQHQARRIAVSHAS